MSKHHRRTVGAFVFVALLATACRPTATDLVAEECLGRLAPPLVVSGTHVSRYEASLPTDGVLDARSATFLGTTPGPNPGPVKLEAPTTGVCMVGADIRFTNDFTTTSWNDWHDAYAMTIRHPEFTSVGLRIDNAGDGIAFTDGADDFRVTGARMTRMHDDCIQNDAMRGGLIEDSFLTCYSGISARGYDDYVFDGGDATLTVRNTLMWARRMPTVPSDYGTTAGHVGWFKFSYSPVQEGIPPRLDLVNVTLRVDAPPLPGHSLDLPPGYRDPDDPTVRLPWPMTCSNVTIVWTGAGPFPGTYPPCVTLTTDVGVWNSRLAAYEADHPDDI